MFGFANAYLFELASDQAERNASLCLGKENASSVIIDINERERVQQLVKEADVVIRYFLPLYLGYSLVLSV